ncbi:MAG: Citrate transporter [Spirochaetes bacterium ADurb.Bin110]|nr:MAG: Citrate transporter [Spirochaetes bacterium ADurb.Bin110]
MIGGLALFSAISARGGIHPASGIFVLVLAFVGLTWLVFAKKEKEEAKNLILHLDWMTLVFLVGIFIVVGVLAESSLLKQLAEQLAQWVKGDVFLAFTLIIAISVLISGFVDNVPYIAAMLPVASALAEAMQVQPDLLMFGLLIGSCLGGNLTPFGASANIVAVGLSEKHGSKVSFWNWVKLAGPFTIITTIAASAFIWLVWA